MIKKILFCISALFCLSSFVYAGNGVPLNYQIKGTSHQGNPKSPVCPWYINQDGNVLTMSATLCDYILNLYDENDELVYSEFASVGTTIIVLPANLSGDFEIRFETDTYYYYGYITI